MKQARNRLMRRMLSLLVVLLLLLQLFGCALGNTPEGTGGTGGTGNSDGTGDTGGADTPPAAQPTVEEKISSAVAEHTSLSNFEYQFFTTAYVDEQPCIFLNGVCEKDGQTKAASVAYPTTEEIYDWFEEFDTTVTANNGSFVFGNDYYVFEDRKADILSYLLQLSEGNPLSTQEMTPVEQKDYVVQNNFEREHNFELSNIQYSHRDEHYLYFTCDGHALKEVTEDGRYVFIKVKYDINQGIRSEDEIKNPDGTYKFIPEYAIFHRGEYNEVIISADEMLSILSQIGENENNPIARSLAASRFPGKYDELIDSFQISVDATQYLDLIREN